MKQHDDAGRGTGVAVTARNDTSTQVGTVRMTQSDRRARTRSALLESAARGFSEHGYTSVTLEQVARGAGYTRGALYHLFSDKEELAVAVVAWVAETWDAEVGRRAAEHEDPVAALLTMAREHVIFCQRDIARVLMSLRVEFAGRAHPVGQAVADVLEELDGECARLIAAGRDNGTIPAGPPPEVLAGAYAATVEAIGIELAGQDQGVELVERAVRGLLGLAAPRGSS